MFAMNMLDIRTLSLVALATSLLLPLVLLAGGQFVGSVHHSTRAFNRGVTLYAAGFLLFALRGLAPDWISIVVANLLIFAGYCELAIGFRMYFRGQASRRLLFMGLTLKLWMLIWYTYIDPSLANRIFYNSIFLGTISSVMAYEFFLASRKLPRTDDASRTERRLLDAVGLAFLLSSCSFMLRTYLFWGLHGDINPQTIGGVTYGVSFVVGILLNFVLAASLPLLISRRNQQELMESRELLAQTEDLAQMGSLVHDLHTQKTMANRVLVNMLDASSPGEVSLQSWLDRLHPQDKPRIEEKVRGMLDGDNNTIHAECRMLRNSGKEPIWISLHCGMRRNAAGQMQFIASMRDITSIKAAAQAALTARDEADRANAAKSTFLANMSHEIRTPMNGVLGLTRLCLEGTLAPRERDLIEKCHSAAQSLLGVVNDILDFSKIEAGKLVVESTAFDLGRTVDNARNLFEQMAGGKGLRFVVDLADDVPAGLVGDPLRLSQVLNNLLGNAVKFTQQGEVRLDILLLKASADQVLVAFSVQDTGIGMTSQQQQNLFQAFSQADASTTRKFGGTGLGLVISRHLTELMGGTLTVESTEGTGTTFTVTLPFGLSSAALQAPSHGQRASGQRLKGLLVLLVEDNPTNVLVATLSLESEGASVVHRADGQLAVDYLRTGADNVDVVLMDIQMPVMDGYTATRIIRTELEMHHLPIIAMTANVMDMDREASRHAGMNAHVGKPFEMDRLVTVILQAVGGAIVIPDPQENAGPVTDTHAMLDLEPALQRMGNNHALMRQAAASFSQDLVGMFQSLRSQDGAADTPLATLHTLKGLTATLGLARAAALTRALEASCRTGAAIRPDQIDALESVVKSSLQALLAALEPPCAHEGHRQDEASPSPCAETQSQAHAVLVQLAEMLAQSDMSALLHFAQHRELLRVHYNTGMTELETALEALEFDTAGAVCSAMMNAK
ncbi:MAG: response regulator [Rhodoferax sp.]|nr:MAG: response regulator [Rhodoferax sp.]